MTVMIRPRFQLYLDLPLILLYMRFNRIQKELHKAKKHEANCGLAILVYSNQVVEFVHAV